MGKRLAKYVEGANLGLTSTVVKGGGEMINIFFFVTLLAPDGFGAYVFGWTVVTLTSVITTLGLDKLIAYKVPRLNEKDDTKAQYKILANTTVYVLFTGLCASVLLLSGIEYFTFYISAESSKWVKALIFMVPILSLRRLSEQWLIAKKRLKKRYIYFRIFPTSTKTVFLLITVVSYWNNLLLNVVDEIAVGIVYVAFILPLLVYFSVIYKKCVKHFNGKIESDDWEYSLGMSLTAIIKEYMWKIDVLFVSVFVNDTATGAYKAIVKLAKLSKLADKLTTPVFKPKIGEFLEKGNLTGLGVEYDKVRVFSFSFGLVFILILITYGREALSLFGPYGDYHVALLILSSGYVCTTAFGNIGNVLVMDGHPYYALGGNILGFVLVLVFNFLLVPSLGVGGAALGTCIAIISQNMFVFVAVKATLGKSLLGYTEVGIGLLFLHLFTSINLNPYLWVYSTFALYGIGILYLLYRFDYLLGVFEKLSTVYISK